MNSAIIRRVTRADPLRYRPSLHFAGEESGLNNGRDLFGQVTAAPGGLALEFLLLPTPVRGQSERGGVCPKLLNYVSKKYPTRSSGTEQVSCPLLTLESEG